MEQDAMVLVGPYNSKEHGLFIDCCHDQVQVNQCLCEMQVSYNPRGAPHEKRGGDMGLVQRLVLGMSRSLRRERKWL